MVNRLSEVLFLVCILIYLYFPMYTAVMSTIVWLGSKELKLCFMHHSFVQASICKMSFFILEAGVNGSET